MKDLKSTISGLKGGKIVLLVVGSENYTKANLQTIKYLVSEEEMPGIYITVNKPYRSIKQTLTENEIKTDEILFIDGISEEVGEKTKRNKNCIFLNSLENLSDLSIAISQAVKSIDAADKFLYLDSLSTLNIYHELSMISRFSHFLTGKMRVWGVSGVLISLQKETNEKLVSRMTQFCDEVINI